MLNRILLVLRREYLTRVRKRSFIVMTILAPILVVLFYGLIIYFAINRDIGDTMKQVYVMDESGLFADKIKNKTNLEFVYGPPVASAAEKVNNGFYAVLVIPPSVTLDNTKGITLIAQDQASMNLVNYIEGELVQIVKDNKLKAYAIDKEVIRNINKSVVNVETEIAPQGDKEGKISDAKAATTIGLASAMLIYIFIFLYGVQVMRGIIEEKTNRIVEVIISSVKPFELMMGKIIGIAMVSLTQFVIWIVLVLALGSIVTGGLSLQEAAMNLEQTAAATGDSPANELSSFLQKLSNQDFVLIFGMFFFYFISGYLFYASLFAAVGSAVDNETDTQQFMMPITMPLVFAFFLSFTVVLSDPNGVIAFWLSIIPFTSPVVMMVRIPFQVPPEQLIISMLCMIAGFIFTVWIAGRIYRVGILMYGKKPSYKELGKWLFYRV